MYGGVEVWFLPITYEPSKGRQFTAHSARSSTVAVPPINLCTLKIQQFTARSARSSTVAVPPINLCTI